MNLGSKGEVILHDMTEGPEGKLILKFAIPFMLAGFFQQLYSMIDAMVVGQNVGEAAMAAVGASQAPLMLVLSIVMGITTSLAVLVSQSYGAHNIEQLRRAVTTALILASAASLILVVVGSLVAEPLLTLLGTTPDIYDNAIIYLKIMFASTPLVVLYNTLGNILRGIGDSKTPLYAVIIATVTNLVLDILFVVVFEWGVAGAAYATVISQTLASTIEIIYIYKHVPLLRFSMKDVVFDKIIAKKMVKIGGPTALQQSLLSVGFLSVQSLVYSFGTATMAAYIAVNKIDTISTITIVNLGNALSFFSGQNVGARKMDRVVRGYMKSLMIAGAFSAVTALIVLNFGDFFITLFVEAEKTDIIAQGAEFMGILCLFYFLFATYSLSAGILRGAGDAFYVMVMAVINLMIRVVASYTLSAIPEIGANGIIWAIPIGWSFAAIMCNLRLLGTKWQKKGLIQKSEGNATA